MLNLKQSSVWSNRQIDHESKHFGFRLLVTNFLQTYPFHLPPPFIYKELKLPK